MANTFLAAQGHRRRQVALRARPGRDRARDHGEGGGGRLRDRAAGRRGGGARVQGGRAARDRGGERLPAGRDDPRRRAGRDRPRSRRRFAEARTLVWNGPLGAFEIPPFNAATDAAARQAASLTRAGRLLSVAGGGDTVAALNASGVGRRLHLRLDRRRRVPRMARGQDPARRRRARTSLNRQPQRGTTMKASRTVQKILELLRGRQSGREGQPLPDADAGAARRHRQDDHPAGRPGLRARAGAQLRAEPGGLRPALPLPARDRRRAERLRRAARHDRGGRGHLRRADPDDPEGATRRTR